MTDQAPDIRFLDRIEIDATKWDLCILRSSNSLIYARSIYLDSMSRFWSALVWNDYEVVMPLPWNRKYGFSYLYQPAFTAQLGLFSKNPIDPGLVEKFIDQAKSRFRFCEIHLNYASAASEGSPRANYILDLGKSYEEIRNGYKKRLIENLREAEPHRLQYLPFSEFPLSIQLFKTQYGKRFPEVRQRDYLHFEMLCRELQQQNMIFGRQVRDTTGELLNASIFLQDDHRIYNIMSVSLPAGREKRAHFYLLDQLIAEFAGKNIILDLEGSDVPGIAEFYRKFGTTNQPYSFLRYNHLPFPFRLFK